MGERLQFAEAPEPEPVEVTNRAGHREVHFGDRIELTCSHCGTIVVFHGPPGAWDGNPTHLCIPQAGGVS